jgi:hypothetical protein
MTTSRSPSQREVWPNSMSNARPVGRITVPSGRVTWPVKVPVVRVTTAMLERIVDELDRWLSGG